MRINILRLAQLVRCNAINTDAQTQCTNQGPSGLVTIDPGNRTAAEDSDTFQSARSACALRPIDKRGGKTIAQHYLARMSLFVLSPETVWNPGILNFSSAPRKILERGMILPRRDVSYAFIARVIFESQVLRFLLALLPFGIAAIIWPAAALPISQAPVAMLLVIGIVELRVLRVPREKRAQMATEPEAARALDTLQFRGRRILAQLAARRGIETGMIYLVVEQSDMVRVPPLTIASIQMDAGKSRLVPLTAEERAIVRDGLFDHLFTERHLFLANQREGVVLRSVAFEARGVSAHARLAAFLEATPAPEKAAT